MSTAAKLRVALFGLGIMGSGMARRLLGAGFPLAIYNRSPDKASALVADGARFGKTPGEAAGLADVIVSMVADDAASQEVWLGQGGALAAATRGAVIIECSTLSVDWVRQLASAAAVRGCEMIDAPVTGSKVQAAAGELGFLVGGSEAALEKVRPVLSVMSRSIVHVGPTGSGSLLKLINNFLCGVQAASLAEAIALIEKSGLNRGKALEVLTNGTPGSPLVKTLSARMTARDYTPNFLIQLMAKDLRYAVEEGNSHSVQLKTAATALEIFNETIASGLGGKDFSVIAEQVRKSGGA
jgi:3-hydroxyisobutyrate dehydrogenase